MSELNTKESWLERQRNIVDFSLQNLLRHRSKNSLILIMFGLLIFVISSILFITGSLTVELFSTAEELPDITIQKILGGRQVNVHERYLPAIKKIPGVESVEPRSWGYFYLAELQANFTVFGLDLALLNEDDYQPIVDWKPKPNSGQDIQYRMIVGEGVYRLLEEVNMEEAFLFFQPNWETAFNFDIIGTFKSETRLQSNDLMVLQVEGARRVLELPDGEYTDLIVYVPNPEEIDTIALKIRRFFPELRTITKSQITTTYESVFSWKSGFMLSSMLVVVFAFLVLIWDKASGLSPQEKQEIGILKAIGWDTEMVLAVKFWEGLIISLLATISGIVMSYAYIYWFHAPGFREIFIGWSVVFPPFQLVPDINLKYFVLIVTLTIIPYCAVTVFPAWKAAITDPDLVMRNN